MPVASTDIVCLPSEVARTIRDRIVTCAHHAEGRSPASDGKVPGTFPSEAGLRPSDLQWAMWEGAVS